MLNFVTFRIEDMQTDTQESLFSKRKRLPWLLGILIFIIMLIAVEYIVGWKAVLTQWQAVPSSTLLPALALFACSYLLRAWRIYDLCQPSLHGRFIAVLKLSVLHLYANNMLPMRLGEGLFPILMKRYFSVGFAEGLARLAWLRILDLMIAGTLIVITFSYFFPTLALIGIALGIVSLLLIYAIYRTKGRIWIIQHSFYPKIEPIVKQLQLTAPKDTQQFVRVVIWTFLSWGCKLAALIMITRALQSLSAFEALAGVLGAELSSILPVHGIAGSGSFEAAFMAGLAPIGLLSSDVLGLAVNLHLFILGATSLFALLCFWIPVAKPTREDISI
ncbi:lysylphosphatidylglycerol synthase transmembrane domain-containing protein [Neptunomonas japonica]|uniref:lysylphosphatidylglycerol synthase transmembrane domain-containing protein n=1 Tax=Neptunomonas japonica TaxID=417574 RepID=UPI0003FBD76E|nr:lysylphosphatidylglycerol synthase transmembrane domain-containing protein [Neptunomonas japonica]